MDENLTEELTKVVVYLVASAPTSLEETPTLAAYRMLDAADRLIALLTADGVDDEFLASAQEEFRANSALAMTDQSAFLIWLDAYARAFARQSITRHTR